MSERERHTPAAGMPHASTAAAPTLALSVERSLWDDWYARATPSQQQEMIALALRQGILYRHQLPPVNGHPAAPSGPLVSLLLGGQAQQLALPALLSLEPVDKALDSRQREAVARALASPDVCLIQGYPGTGKSRVAVEIILQALQRGLRVLLLAPTAAAIDHILEHLVGQPGICSLRCLGAAETLSSVPPCLRPLTLVERGRSFEQETLPAAREQLRRSQQALQALGCLLERQAHLGRLAQQLEETMSRRQTMLEHRDRLPAAVRAETVEAATQPVSDFQKAWQACVQTYQEQKERLQGQQAVWQAERETIRGKQEQLVRELEEVRPLHDAREARRWWTGAWWRAMVGVNPMTRLTDLEGRLAELQAALTRLDAELAGCRQQLQQAETDYEAQTERMLDAEVARRQTTLDEQLAQLAEQQRAMEREWQALAVPDAPPLPQRITQAALREACADWSRQREQLERETAAAQQWLAALEETVAHLPERLGSWANLTAATTGAVLAGALPANALSEGFDLLVLEEAHRVTESELTGVARYARRWVLLGEPPLDEQAGMERSAGSLRRGALRPGVFQRFWQHLHADPQRLPCSWHEHQGRLVCRLCPVPPEQKSFLESEPLADRPDIELRILSVPRQRPQLAEVVFPAGWTIADAKALLHRELEELTTQAAGSSLHWSETPGHILAELGQAPPVEAVRVCLADGLTEVVGCRRRQNDSPASEGSWYTWQLEFDRGAGWTREGAEQWVRERLHLHDLRRTALLSAPYRGQPGLVHFLSDLLFAGACEPAAGSASSGETTGPPVEMVPVPPLPQEQRRPGEEPSGHAVSSLRVRLRSVKGGAGLEQDLSESRPLDHLPADLRALLPQQGLVNYLEAQAIVKRLEELAGDPDLLAAAARWQQQHRLHPLAAACIGRGSKPSAACPAAMPVVAVMAPYAAQVELIRLLVQRSAVLASAPLSLEIGLPSDFQHRECLLALVSLTRSHTHRAVCYGDSPEVLVQALTRPAGRLILFGDPATLVRRSQWNGPLDHLDERSAQRERRLLARLVSYLQGQGPYPQSFRVQEGCGV